MRCVALLSLVLMSLLTLVRSAAAEYVIVSDMGGYITDVDGNDRGAGSFNSSFLAQIDDGSNNVEQSATGPFGMISVNSSAGIIQFSDTQSDIFSYLQSSTFGNASLYDGFTVGPFNFLQTGGPTRIFYLQSLSIAPYYGAVPEASTWTMMLLGFGGFGLLACRSKRQLASG